MIVRSYITVLLLLFSFAAVPADYSTPKARVKDAIEKVLKTLKDKSLNRDRRWEEIAAVIRERFDFRSMSQSVLARNWKRATAEEQRRFTEFFSQYIEETYRAKIEAYTDQKIEYGDEVIRGDRAVVETKIITGATEIPVNFKLRKNKGEWYAYDVIIEGVSLVSNYRNTFAAIVKNEGMEGLMSDIQRRINKYKQEKAQAGGASTGEGSAAE